MVLSDNDIWEAIETGDLEIRPPDGLGLLVQPSSIDLRLDSNIHVTRPELVNDAEIVDPTKLSDVAAKLAECTEPRDLHRDQPYILGPGSFVPGATAEHVSLSNALAARIEGKSSLARYGVAVHLTAPKIDPGFSNQITLEIINLGPFRVYIYPMMEIAALIVERLSSPAAQVYTGRFSSERSPQKPGS